MARLWPLLLVLVAIGAIAYFFVGGEEGGLLGDAADHEEDEDYVAPELRGHGKDADWRNPTDRPPAPERTEPPPETTPEDDRVVFLEGQVLDAETEAPLKGARVWLLPHEEPCPRLADSPTIFQGLGQVDLTTDPQGRFQVRAQPEYVPATGTFDVFASAKGHILGVVCTPTTPGEITMRLERGLKLEGRVRAPDGRAVEDASIRARPAPETPATPGHGTVGPTHPSTDENGRFAIDGLLPGDLLLDVEHAHFMPQTVGPHDPENADDLEITLVPALRATFQIRTDDGRDPEHPTLVWRTTGANPRSDVLLLAAVESRGVDHEDGTTPGEMTSQTVRLPCDAPSVVLQLKADGYATWTSEPLRLPSEGGEETYEITLTGDLATGSAKISLEDDAGEALNFAEAAVEVAVMQVTQGARSSAYVLEQREDLRITDLPAGLYRIVLRSALFAPVETDLTIEVGQEAEALLRTRPPAKVKVRFVADNPTMVRFRLTQGNEVIHGVPEGSFARGTDEQTGEPILSAGQDGLLLSGLAAGTYTIEVLSDEHTAPPTVVHLNEGDTTEIEIRVRLR